MIKKEEKRIVYTSPKILGEYICHYSSIMDTSGHEGFEYEDL